VNHLLTSVVREICTLRSVGAGERATALGHPVGTRQLVSLPRSTATLLARNYSTPPNNALGYPRFS